jgi:hypothetical protein
MNDNPLQDSPERNDRIRTRAYLLWEQNGKPEGQDGEFWERARELIAIEDHPTAGLLPNPMAERRETAVQAQEAELQENLGESPSRPTDQGDRAQTPVAKRGRGRRNPGKTPGVGNE